MPGAGELPTTLAGVLEISACYESRRGEQLPIWRINGPSRERLGRRVNKPDSGAPLIRLNLVVSSVPPKANELRIERESVYAAGTVARSPEKAGVGGSTPSLATMFSITHGNFLDLS